MKKERLDQLLVQKKLFESRNKAQAAILAGIIFVDDKKIDKSGTQINLESKIEIKGNPCPYVSRGGLKLEAALKKFKVNPQGKTCLDVGSSTGGFTDCLLQNGATRVFAVDVGYGIIDWKIRNDLRVILIERTNARYLDLKTLGLTSPQIELAVIDVSFISLSKILPAIKKVLTPEAEVIALIKPQFEAGKGQVGKGGIVKYPAIHQAVIKRIKEVSMDLGFKNPGIIDSPITGRDGNKEFLIHLKV